MIVLLFTICGIQISLKHCHRYKYNATALLLETDYRAWRYSMFGVTVCSNYTNEYATKMLVKQLVQNISLKIK